MQYITPNIKAIAAFLAAAIISPLAYFNITPDTTVETAVTIILIAFLNAAVVWLSPRNE